MAREKEKKYVMKPKSNDYIIDELSKRMYGVLNENQEFYVFGSKIEQYYLKNGIRVRKQENFDPTSNNNVYKYFLTYKHKIKEKDTNLEFEMEIGYDEFELIKNDSEKGIKKYRYSVFFNNYEHWDIDVYCSNDSNDSNEMIIAECEMDFDIGQKFPYYIPGFIVNNILIEVQNEDKRFNTEKLTNTDHYNNIIKTIYDLSQE